jgi:hypothetical protein
VCLAQEDSISEDLSYLTSRERQLFDELSRQLGCWIETRQTALRMFGFAHKAELHALSAIRYRLRAKLRRYGSSLRIEVWPSSMADGRGARHRLKPG